MMRHLGFHPPPDESTVRFFHARDHKDKRIHSKIKNLHVILNTSKKLAAIPTQRSMAGSAHTDSEAKLSNLDMLQFFIASSIGHASTNDSENNITFSM
jgi:hypothetical protein